jgi:hypothetical protein
MAAHQLRAGSRSKVAKPIIPNPSNPASACQAKA